MPPTWKYAAISVPGDRHIRTMTPCADVSAAMWHEGTESLILVAADGAGSAQHAAEGATMAVDTVVTHVPRLLDELNGPIDTAARLDAMVVDAVRVARERIERAARETAHAGPSDRVDHDHGGAATDPLRGRSVDGFATTLLVVVLTPRHLAAVQVGDGYVVRITEQEEFLRLFQPARGRFANETSFITSLASFDDLVARGQVQTRVLDANGTTGVALITDGLEPIAMDMRAGGVPHPPFFAGLLDAFSRYDPPTFAAHVERYLRRSPKVRERSDDDMTLVLALDSRRSAAVGKRRPADARHDPTASDGSVTPRSPVTT